jgi:hypothetical protein
MKLITSTPPTKTIPFDEVFELVKQGKGFVVCVYNDEAEILLNVPPPENESFTNSKFSVAFVNLRENIYTNFNLSTRTDGMTRPEAWKKVMKRLTEEPTECKYYYFNNLHDFAAAVIENGWN